MRGRSRRNLAALQAPALGKVTPRLTFTGGDWETAIIGDDQWDWLEVEDALRMVRTPKPYPVRQGRYSCRVQVRPGDDPNGERAEVSWPQAANVKMGVDETTGTQYVGWSMYLPSNWTAPTGTDPWALCTQLHGPDAFSASPIWAMKVLDTIYIEMCSGDVDSPSWPTYSLSDNSLNLGAWSDFMLKIVYHKSNGSWTLWRRNGSETAWTEMRTVTGVPTLQYKTSVNSGAVPTGVNGAYWKQGYYRIPQASIVNTLYVDGFTTGTSFNKVAAAAFSGQSGAAVVGCRSFNGTTHRIDWANVANLAGGAITVSAWVNPAALGSSNYIFCINNATPNAALAFVNIHSTGQLQFQRPGTTTLYRYCAQGLMSTGTWYHLLATHDGTFNDYTTIHIYKNGTEVSYTGGGGVNGATEQALTGLWSIGGRSWDDARNFNAKICQVSVWNRVLSGSEITALAGGASANTYSTGLQWYWPGNVDTLADIVTESDGTLDGTTTSTDGPTITYP